MTVGFSQVPRNALVPFVYVEIDDSRAATGPLPFRSLLVGQRIAAGSIGDNVPIQLSGAADAAEKFGAGSILHGMTASFRRLNPLGELWGVAASAGATAQAQTVTIGGAPTAAGEIALYVAGRRISTSVASGDTLANIATAVAAAINAAEGLPATAAAAAAVVTVTARNAGLGGEVDIRTNYYATDALPVGVTVAIAQTVPAAGDAGVAAAMDKLGADQLDVVATAYSGATPIAALETDLAGRWNATMQLDGVGIAALRGTVADAQTYASGRASKYVSVMDAATSPMPAWEWAATIAGAVAQSAEADPGLPFQTMELRGLLPEATADRRTHAERETLLGKGIATHVVDGGGTCLIERMVTTAEGTAWRDLNTALTLSFLRRSFRQRMGKYARFKLANDGAPVAAGQRVLTPAIGRAEAIAWYREMEGRGLVEGGDAFKAALVVERNADDPNRLDFMLPPDLVNQLRITAARLAFAL